VLAARLIEWIAPIIKEGRKNVVDRRRWRLSESAFLETCFAGWSDRDWETAQGCGVARSAVTAATWKTTQAGPSAKVRQEPGQSGQTSRHRDGWGTAQCTIYGKTVTKLCKTLLATYRPAGGRIHVVIVEEDRDWRPFFSADPNATAVEIIEAFADRATIKQDFHDVKEVWGAGQQQVPNIWTNLAVYHLDLWIHTLAGLWSWNRSHAALCDRRLSPWDDAARRPSPADRHKALCRHIMEHELSMLAAVRRLPQKILLLTKRLITLAT
jgi:hypothetical protein